MSRSDAWMPLYIGDYLADTGHLNAQQHGAYLLMLMHQWCKGPLPDDDRQLCAITKMDLGTWRRVVAPVVRPFFAVGENGLTQKRLTREREKANAISVKRSGAGTLGASLRWPTGNGKCHDSTIANGIANGWQIDSKCHDPLSPPTSPLPSPSVPLPLPPIPPPPLPTTFPPFTPPTPSLSPARRADDTDLFPEQPVIRRRKTSLDDPDRAAFWAIYPRKKDGPASFRDEWVSARTEASAEDIIAGLKRYPFTADPKFWPMPSTWLNQKRWLTQSDTVPVTIQKSTDKLSAIDIQDVILNGGLHQSPQDYFDADPGSWSDT